MGHGSESIVGEIKEEQDSRNRPELMLEEKLVDILLKHVLSTQSSKFLACEVSSSVLCLPYFIVMSEFNVLHKMYSE